MDCRLIVSGNRIPKVELEILLITVLFCVEIWKLNYLFVRSTNSSSVYSVISFKYWFFFVLYCEAVDFFSFARDEIVVFYFLDEFLTSFLLIVMFLGCLTNDDPDDFVTNF